MRLIDADLLTEKVKKWLNSDPSADRMVDIDDIAVSVLMEIEEQPTAYNPDAVAKELRNYAIEFEAFGMCSEYVELRHAIGLVKGGR